MRRFLKIAIAALIITSPTQSKASRFGDKIKAKFAELKAKLTPKKPPVAQAVFTENPVGRRSHENPAYGMGKFKRDQRKSIDEENAERLRMYRSAHVTSTIAGLRPGDGAAHAFMNDLSLSERKRMQSALEDSDIVLTEAPPGSIWEKKPSRASVSDDEIRRTEEAYARGIAHQLELNAAVAASVEKQAKAKKRGEVEGPHYRRALFNRKIGFAQNEMLLKQQTQLNSLYSSRSAATNGHGAGAGLSTDSEASTSASSSGEEMKKARREPRSALPTRHRRP